MNSLPHANEPQGQIHNLSGILPHCTKPLVKPCNGRAERLPLRIEVYQRRSLRGECHCLYEMLAVSGLAEELAKRLEHLVPEVLGILFGPPGSHGEIRLNLNLCQLKHISFKVNKHGTYRLGAEVDRQYQFIR